jgi:hypothetical protein
MIQTADKAALLRAATLVKPAMASQEFVPALTHIKFDGERATAYNDVMAITVECKTQFTRCVPGDLLIKALGALPSSTVVVSFDEGTSVLLLSAGRSKLKLPTLPTRDFPFDMPTGSEVPPEQEIVLTPDVMRGIEQCLVSVGSNPKHPAQLGVTLDVDSDGCAVLFSTDNYSLSRFQTSAKVSLPGGSPIILPTFLCQQAVTLAKAFPEQRPVLVPLGDSLLIDFGGALAFSKMVLDLEPLDFGRIFSRHCNLKELKGLGAAAIPDQFDSALGRALLVLQPEVAKTTTVEVSAGMVSMSSSSSSGDSFDEMDWPNPATSERFDVDPSLIDRSVKFCSRIAFRPKVVVLTDEPMAFVHLISHCST